MTTRMTSLQDRLRILELAAEGQSDAEIAQQMEWKERTVRKWRRLGQKGGRQQLATRLGRPRMGAMGSFKTEERERLCTLRQEHPGWGAQTLHSQLQVERAAEASERTPGERIPSRATIARLLKERGLVQRYERHGGVAEAGAPPAQAPHDVWEMDACGQQRVPGVGVVMLVHVNDRHSRAKLLSYPCVVGESHMQHRPAFKDYQLALRLAFAEWGLPMALCVDRDSVFFDNTSRSPFPSRLELWLTGLGVELVVGRRHRPTDRGMTERSHQTWTRQVLAGQQFVNADALWERLEERKDFLNYSLACRSTQNLAPLVACPLAATPVHPYDPQFEPELFDVARIHRRLAPGRWFRTASNAAIVSLGSCKYWLGTGRERFETEIRFDPEDHHLHFVSDSGDLLCRHPLKGVSHAELCGSYDQFFSLRPYQYSLLADWPQLAMARLIETRPGMTF